LGTGPVPNDPKRWFRIRRQGKNGWSVPPWQAGAMPRVASFLAVAASLPDLLIRARSFLRISDENRRQGMAGAWMHG
jgi:hypothetical protein